jgi:hypothetical protein
MVRVAAVRTAELRPGWVDPATNEGELLSTQYQSF